MIEINLPINKSLVNRQLIIKHLLNPDFEFDNVNYADDIIILNKGILDINNTKPYQTCIINVGHAGTAMRFLIAYACIQKHKKIIITGSQRMLLRPIETLVESINTLGGNITYLNKNNFAPILIQGKVFTNNTIDINTSISSQFISALMLIGPFLKNGIIINLKGDAVSWPYIEQTANILKYFKAELIIDKNQIVIPNKQLYDKELYLEKDWSAAAFFYCYAIVNNTKEIILKNISKVSLQGDAYTATLFGKLGVSSTEHNGNISLLFNKNNIDKFPEIDLLNTPDLAQPFIVACAAIKKNIKITGLQTLANKETNRLIALKTELEKFNCDVEITSNSFLLNATNFNFNANVTIKTYNDHRMAMAFSSFLPRCKNLEIQNKEVVTKSFPDFWLEFYKLNS